MGFAQLAMAAELPAADGAKFGKLLPVPQALGGGEILCNRPYDLAATLLAWLSRHGQVDAAAADLGVHRHTVRHRLRRAEALASETALAQEDRAALQAALNAAAADAELTTAARAAARTAGIGSGLSSLLGGLAAKRGRHALARRCFCAREYPFLEITDDRAALPRQIGRAHV